jgi:hypothetical protein
MAVVKWVLFVVLAAAGAAAIGYAYTLRPAAAEVSKPSRLPPLELRAFPLKLTAAGGPASPDAGTGAELVPDAGVPRAVAAEPGLGAGPKPATPAPQPPAPAKEPKPTPKPAEPPPPPAPVAQGLLDLQANDAADVFIDGKKAGASPVLGLKVKVGPHKVRFDCYDPAGNTMPGQTQTVVVRADETSEVTFTCPRPD